MDWCYRCYHDLLGTFPNTVHINAKYRATNREDSFTFLQENTINEMVKTISHRFNTHVKRLSFSASVVIIIITRLLATSRIITQYFNHLPLFNFTTSPLKIDEPLSTFQFCILWLGTFGNWYEFLIVGSLSICFKWYSASRRKTKLNKEETMPLIAMSTWTDVPWYFCDKESYLSWLFFLNVAFPYMQPTYFHLIMSLHLLSFPKHSKTYLKS